MPCFCLPEHPHCYLLLELLGRLLEGHQLIAPRLRQIKAAAAIVAHDEFQPALLRRRALALAVVAQRLVHTVYILAHILLRAMVLHGSVGGLARLAHSPIMVRVLEE